MRFEQLLRGFGVSPRHEPVIVAVAGSRTPDPDKVIAVFEILAGRWVQNLNGAVEALAQLEQMNHAASRSARREFVAAARAGEVDRMLGEFANAARAMGSSYSVAEGPAAKCRNCATEPAAHIERVALRLSCVTCRAQLQTVCPKCGLADRAALVFKGK